MLQVERPFLDGATGDELDRGDDVFLADAMGAVGRLRFDGGIPPRVEMNHGVRGGEVQADSAGFEADQEDRDGGVVLEAIDLRADPSSGRRVAKGDAVPSSRAR